MSGYLFMGCGELFIMPPLIASITNSMPVGHKATITGILYLGLAYSAYWAGYLASSTNSKNGLPALPNYFHTYSTSSLIMLTTSVTTIIIIVARIYIEKKKVPLMLQKAQKIKLLNQKSRDAALKGQLSILKNLVEQGATFIQLGGYPLRDLGLKNEDTILHIAAKNNYIDILRYAIEQGAQIDLKNRRGETPLQHATDNNNLQIISTLIDNGADIEIKDDDGDTAVGWAANSLNETLEALEALTKVGANINNRNSWDNTPLHWAAYQGRLDRVKLLVANGANVTHKNDYDQNAIDLAQESGHEEVVRYLKSL